MIWQYPEWVGDRITTFALAAGITACALALPAVSHCQNASPTLRQMFHTAWTVREGAPAEITKIVQAPDGFLFLATTTGLYRFDGVRFEAFELPSGQRLVSRSVTALEILPTGDIWTGYAFGGASRVVGGHVTDYGEADGLPRGQLKAFAVDSEGTVWAATSTGLARLVGTRWRRAAVDRAIPDTNTTALMVDRHGTLWAASFAGVYSLARGAHAFVRRSPTLGDTDNAALAVAPDGSVWGSATVGGLTSLAAPDGGAVRSVGGRRGPAQLRSVFFDSDGNAWLGAVGHLSWLGARPEAFRNSGGRPARSTLDAARPSEEQSMARKDGLSGDRVLALLQDREGNVWIGTEGGLDRFRATKLTAVELPDLLGPAVANGKIDEIWIASLESSPLVMLNGAVRSTIGPADIECAYRDPDGGVWLGGEKGLWRIADGATTRVEKPGGFADASVQAIARQGDETLWLSLVRAGVFRRRGTGAWSPFANGPEGGRLPAVTIVADGTGRTWLGYTQDRLARVSPDNSVRLFTAADGMRIGTVTAVYVRGSNVWVGGESGLMLLDGDRLLGISASDPDALRGISGIVQKAGGELWVSGAAGVVRLPEAELRRARTDTSYRVQAERFDFRDGVTGVATQIRPLPSAIEAGDGRLWFATSTSVLTIDPGHVRRNRLPPPVQIRGIEAGGRSYAASDSIRLPARTTSLQIRYTALSLTIPERVRFRYQLVGTDREWQDAGTRREAFYTNLGPGTHRFRVVAANEDGVWNDAGASINVYIPPTFVQTNAFVALCAAVVAWFVWLLLQWRQRRVTAGIRNRFEITLIERTRIAQELHDTLLQGFVGVTAQLYAVRALLHTRPADAESTLSDALANADVSLRDARQAVWELRSPVASALTLPEALAAVREAVSPSSAIQRCIVKGAARPLPRATELAALRIARECIVNAMKHADADTVSIELRYESSQLVLVVSDDGCGFAPETESAARQTGHWGIVGMRERAADAGGSLVVDSVRGKGTRITLTLPIEGAV